MKTTPSLPALLAAGALFCDATVSATEEPVLTRPAETLCALASEMEETFGEGLRLRHARHVPSRAELLFRESLCQLAGIARQFHHSVELHAPPCDLERGFAAVEEAFACVGEGTHALRLDPGMRDMMREFGEAMACVEDTGFEPVSPRHASHAHRHPHHHQAPAAAPSGGHNGWFRVPMSQSPGFIFRQPLR